MGEPDGRGALTPSANQRAGRRLTLPLTKGAGPARLNLVLWHRQAGGLDA